MRKMIKYMVFAALHFLPATSWADAGFQFDVVALQQAEGARADLGISLFEKSPDQEKQGFFIPLLRFGISENVKLTQDGYYESDHFLSSSIGGAYVAPQLAEGMRLYTELTFGVDGIGLKNPSGSLATHFFARSLFGLRVGGLHQHVFIGTGFQSRSLPEKNRTVVNGRPLSRYAVMPAFGLGWTF